MHLPSLLSTLLPFPAPPIQAAYLGGKEAFGPVFAQRRKATGSRTLACTDGLLSCRQNFIQFVYREVGSGSEMRLALASGRNRAARSPCNMLYEPGKGTPAPIPVDPRP